MPEAVRFQNPLTNVEKYKQDYREKEVDIHNLPEIKEEDLARFSTDSYAINLQTFQPAQLDENNIPEVVPHDTFALIFGKRRAGKTTYLEYILSVIGLIYTEIYVFTSTPQNRFWTQHAPYTRIYHGLDGKSAEVLKTIIETQKRKRDFLLQYMTMHPDAREIPFSPLILIILDDVMSEQTLTRHNDLLNYLVYNGRHIDISTYMLLQDIVGAPPGWRYNADMVAATFSPQTRFLKYLKDSYFPYVKLQEFIDFYHAKTTDYNLIVFMQAKAQDDLKKVVYQSKSPTPDHKFIIGTMQFWKDAKCDPRTQLKAYRGMKVIGGMDLEDWKRLRKREDSKFRKSHPNIKTFKDFEEDFTHIPNLVTGKEKPRNPIPESEWAEDIKHPKTFDFNQMRYALPK